MDLVDLYIDGADFYRNATAERLKIAWCNFTRLGDWLARSAIGSDTRVGRIIYFDSPLHRQSDVFGSDWRREQWQSALRAVVKPRILRSVGHDLSTIIRNDMALIISSSKDEPSEFESGIHSLYQGLVRRASIPEIVESSRFDDFRIPIGAIEEATLPDTIDISGRKICWPEYQRSKDVGGDIEQFYRKLGDQLTWYLSKESGGASLDLDRHLPRAFESASSMWICCLLQNNGFDFGGMDRNEVGRYMVKRVFRDMRSKEVTRKSRVGSDERIGLAAWAPEFLREFKTLTKNRRDLEVAVFRAIQMYDSHPENRGLNVEDIGSGRRSLRVNDDVRVIFKVEGGKATLLSVKPHDPAYRWNKRQGKA